MKKIALLVVIFTLILSGCNPFSSQQQSTVVPITSFLLNENPDLVATLTPFQPIAPTPTKTQIPPTATRTPRAGSTSVPITQYNTFPTLTNQNIDTPDGQVRILLLGSDYRPGRGYRTDVIMLLVLNPKAGTATLTSFPRDLYVTIPGIGMERINTAHEYGGFALTVATFETNFGISPDYYMMTNFNGFKSIIDTLGGIDVYAASNFSDECSVRSREDGMGNCNVYAGMNHMDGEFALWYVRSRYTTSDFDRTRRAQEVIQAIFMKLMSLGAVNRASELYSEFNSSVETNLSLSTIVSLLPLANTLANDTSRVRRYAIGSAETYNYIVPGSGAMVLIPIQSSVMSIIYQAVSQ
jgi:LCP family protein required for cell wall assembly